MPNISLTPDPPVSGESVLICVNGAVMPLDVIVTIAGKPPVTVHITKFCEYWTVPPGTKGTMVNFHDNSGQANDESRMIA